MKMAVLGAGKVGGTLGNRFAAAGATASIAWLAESIGFEAIVWGNLTRARAMEPAAALWIASAGVLGSREFAWGVLRR